MAVTSTRLSGSDSFTQVVMLGPRVRAERGPRTGSGRASTYFFCFFAVRKEKTRGWSAFADHDGKAAVGVQRQRETPTRRGNSPFDGVWYQAEPDSRATSATMTIGVNEIKPDGSAIRRA
jgi:hypothetical protein